jgi:hypothetical protein
MDRTNTVSRAAPLVVSETAGRLTVVNAQLKFVVIDFGSRSVPVAGTRLAVHRDGKNVGLVRCEGPAHGRFASADILHGDLQVGDEVR